MTPTLVRHQRHQPSAPSPDLVVHESLDRSPWLKAVSPETAAAMFNRVEKEEIDSDGEAVSPAEVRTKRALASFSRMVHQVLVRSLQRVCNRKLAQPETTVAEFVDALLEMNAVVREVSGE